MAAQRTPQRQVQRRPMTDAEILADVLMRAAVQRAKSQPQPPANAGIA